MRIPTGARAPTVWRPMPISSPGSPMRLATEAPFNLEATVRVLQRRPSNLIDRWDHARYRRMLRLGDRPVLIEVVNHDTLEAPARDLVR